MSEWSGRGVCLGLRRFGETGAILDIFARDQGRRRGLVYGGASRSRRAVMQAGNTLAVTWRARTDDNLGHWAVAEPEGERTARLLSDASALAALAAIAATLLEALPEGEAKPGLFDATETLLDSLIHQEIWPALYVRWELGLLQALGYGLDLSHCALTGANDHLTHVSPRSGRAVRGSEAPEYLDRLLVLPAFLVDASAPASARDVASGFRLTGHFLSARLFADVHKGAPEARGLMIDRLVREGRASPAGASDSASDADRAPKETS